MEYPIRHRRLYAFYQSKVLNMLMLILIAGLLLSFAVTPNVIPIICSSISFLCFFGYSLWLWIKRPTSVIINPLLSNISSCFTLYFLIIHLFKSVPALCYTLPAILSFAFLLFFLTPLNKSDKLFAISQ